MRISSINISIRVFSAMKMWYNLNKGRTINEFILFENYYCDFLLLIIIKSSKVNNNVCTGCVTKIRTNFNLNFPLYCASARDCCWRPRKPDASNKQLYSQNGCLKPSAKYNRRAAIIEGRRAGRSATEIIRFFGYPRSTVYDIVIKYTTLEQFKISVC